MAVKRSSWLSFCAVITLLIAVFAAPSVDAAVCTTEASIAAIHSVADHPAQNDAGDADSRNDDSGERGSSHGLCSHGHCHHGGVGRIESGIDPITMAVNAARPFFLDDNPPSSATEGLKRPPRG